MYSYLVIDCSAIAYPNAYTLKGLRTNEIETGVIYGFLNQILSLSEQFKTNNFVFCWDSKESKREEIFPEYKKKRKEKKRTPEEKNFYLSLYRQVNRLRKEILPSIGFNNSFHAEGFEADDIMADIVMHYEKCLMVTGDEDLYQMLDMADLYKPITESIWTLDRFRKEYNIGTFEWIDVKAIAGCTSDEIPGAPGVGEKRAIQWIKKELKPSTKAYQSILASKDIIERNYQLVTLPFEGLPEFTIKANSFNMDNFISICKEYWIDSYLSKIGMARWYNFFNRGKVHALYSN